MIDGDDLVRDLLKHLQAAHDRGDTHVRDELAAILSRYGTLWLSSSGRYSLGAAVASVYNMNGIVRETRRLPQTLAENIQEAHPEQPPNDDRNQQQ